MKCLKCKRNILGLSSFDCEGEKINKCNFEFLKKQYPLLTQDKLKALLTGEKDILLISTENYDDYYSIHHGKLISTKFVDKKNINIHIER